LIIINKLKDGKDTMDIRIKIDGNNYFVKPIITIAQLKRIIGADNDYYTIECINRPKRWEDKVVAENEFIDLSQPDCQNLEFVCVQKNIKNTKFKTKFKIEIDQKLIITEIQFINIGNLRELFLQRGSINEEDKWKFYLIIPSTLPDKLVDLKFMLDLNTSPYPRFYSVDTTPMSGG